MRQHLAEPVRNSVCKAGVASHRVRVGRQLAGAIYKCRQLFRTGHVRTAGAAQSIRPPALML